MKIPVQFKNFIKSIKSADRLVMAYDKDGDGVSAVVQAKVALSRINLESKVIPFERADIESFTNELKHLKPTHVVFFDVSAEQHPEIFDALPKTKFMVIDHHKRYGSHKNAVVIKPEDLGYKKDPSSYPTAKMSHDLFSEIADISDLDWLASVGVISDSGYAHWQDFVDRAMKRKRWKKGNDIYESIPGKIAGIINASNAIHESRITEATDVVLTLSPSKILKSDLAKLSDKVWKEIKKMSSGEEGAKYMDGRIILIEIQSEYKIAGFVSNLISRKHPASACVIMDPTDNWVKISGRCQTGGVPMNEVLEQATRLLPAAKAGGHKPAAGAIIRKKDYMIFKHNIVEEIKKFLK